MNKRKALIHIRALIKAREREGSSGSTKAKVVASQWALISEERYKVQLHDQIRLTLTERGWVPVIAGKDGSLVGWAPTSANTFKTPEEALADLRTHHDI
ncbi:hypothetical protein Nham_2359 [Nitrobacter hamburgensis X14]|jgi:hypothetical protein|uniref:Uncharacterized protein n=1 Tax=Nitrobacter hamburgensis (strain DSM 10229 / NCIMB 13809 / X14) TaxID=323097 RepID=Q1QKU6_NITHX|nr:hypothetical protein [Nitrobacter hamburgensis]ABE63151.1 hypothetical protein Nham_2359 [Nitrobacter hamburgensis X14]